MENDEQVDMDHQQVGESTKSPFEYSVAELWKDVQIQRSPESEEFHKWWNEL